MSLRARFKASGSGGPNRGRHAAGGFTLLEVLIAFSLLALGLGLLLAILSDGVRSVGRATESTRATLYAQGLLDSLGADQRLQPGRSQGEFEQGRYRWTLDIARFPVALPAPAGDAGLQDPAENLLYRVVLQIRWGEGGGERRLQVETLRAYAPVQGVQP